MASSQKDDTCANTIAEGCQDTATAHSIGQAGSIVGGTKHLRNRTAFGSLNQHSMISASDALP